MSTTISCRFAWCDAETHPDRDRIAHRAHLATYGDGHVFLRMAWAERLDGATTLALDKAARS